MLHISSASDSADGELSKCMWQVTSERTRVCDELIVSAPNAIQPPLIKSYYYFSFTIVFFTPNSSIYCSFKTVERDTAVAGYQPTSAALR